MEVGWGQVRLLLLLCAWSAWLGCEGVNFGGRMAANYDYAYDYYNDTAAGDNITAVWYNGTYVYWYNGTYYTENPEDSEYYTWAKVVLAILMFLTGCLFCFGGYRMFRKMVLLLGFLFFAIFTFLVLYSFTTLEWYWMLLISLPVGILGAVLFHFLFLVGVFCVGVVLGFLLGMVLMSFVNYYAGDSTATSTWFIALTWAVIFTFALVSGIVTVKFQRALLIIGTSVGGAYLMVATFDYLISDGSFSEILVNVFTGAYQDFNSGWVAYLMVFLWLLASLIGIVVQFQLTAKGYQHAPKKTVNETTHIINVHH
mmetsp:Transcript_19550/g.75067  ORF Transcript_19550/g.75067 Transcript_19550/m.75067 type:complete len:312 (-) Transcript_19550:43-978(-)